MRQPSNAAADPSFAALARAQGLDPGSRWIGGYVDYQWSRLPPLIKAYGIDVIDQPLLELGCNVGASAIVLAQLGARVEAIDVDQATIRLAETNAGRFGLSQTGVWRIGPGRVRFIHRTDTRHLPYPDGTFGIVALNSVLEYIAPDRLAAVQREVDRVLAPGGLILITGTSSRLWPREAHSGRWLLHWLPRRLGKRLAGRRRLEHGVWPWQVRSGFGAHYRNLDAADAGHAFIAARAAMTPPADSLGHRVLASMAGLMGIGPGLLANSISCVLRKDASPTGDGP